ncbi:hypothetical protein CROQUDRAFT_96770 [Cronartium quercuum f. sp. fusiforme G11]|uniref:Uncharacterized protein n=1 Tax=Cronartium quercuum f. sp. fusiforme G11 TaxID=708437 RepID=A0A9P6NAP3_9BASI|nr:hypothetical protein CROQUDRAFT_96770 [Cronartium quercuum f. sp. fusiforme G11]
MTQVDSNISRCIWTKTAKGSPPQQYDFKKDHFNAQLIPKPGASTSNTPSLYPNSNQLYFPVKPVDSSLSISSVSSLLPSLNCLPPRETGRV